MPYPWFRPDSPQVLAFLILRPHVSIFALHVVESREILARGWHILSWVLPNVKCAAYGQRISHTSHIRHLFIEFRSVVSYCVPHAVQMR